MREKGALRGVQRRLTGSRHLELGLLNLETQQSRQRNTKCKGPGVETNLVIFKKHDESHCV